jgi:ATP-binding cassette subfamily B protein
MDRMFALLGQHREVQDAPGAVDVPDGSVAIRFDRVDFGYDPARQILHAVSFEVPAGAKVAVVGHSGSGKSTLARLLYRFYDVQGGSVSVGGVDVRRLRQQSLRASIGIVPQDTVLFNDTIGYNIGYGRAGATQAEIEEAARGAQIADFIAMQPGGYAARVGERGLKLSGGEKQRVAIARTLLKNPPILILDEATSALDSRTESDIQATLEAIGRGRTTIVIAHRLSTVVNADEIVVLEAGTVVERGTHNALLRQGGLYAEMWNRQAQERAEEEGALAAE